jgi:DNA-binding NtrC family response regulator
MIAMKFKALIIDDDEATLDLMRFRLESDGFDVTTAERGLKAIEQLKETEFDIVLTDYNLPDTNGIEIVRASKENSPETEIIMITAFGSVDKAIEATKAGAFYYVEKPVKFDDLRVLIEKAVERKQQKREIRELRGRLSSRSSYEGIIGGSRAMQDIYEIIDSVAETDANIFILGESGTGKEVIANAIHYNSLRSKKPFVKVNCSALPKDLIESQLFGHTKGSFTGATSDKTGFIGQASKGSLLLDEIAEMPVELQPKLLRVLQERVYYSVGSDSPQEADFRLISATNRDPMEAIAEGMLREDLYYRINTIEIRIPPLRERMEDVPALAEHFLGYYSEKYRRPVSGFAQTAFDQMLNYTWRGNVRELQHSIERAVLLCKTDSIRDLRVPGGEAIPAASSDAARARLTTLASGLTGDAFFDEIGRTVISNLPDAPFDDENRDVFDLLEKGIVRAVLSKTGGNKQAASKLLNVYRPRLYGIIKRHGLD